MNRTWLLIGGAVAALVLAAVIALKVGGVVGGSIVPSPATTRRPEEPARPVTTRFVDNLTDVAISYPSDWQRRQPGDATVRLLAVAPDSSTALSISVRKSGLEYPVTEQTLPVVRPLTDDLLRADARVTAAGDGIAVRVGGLPGYRYEYTYKTDGGTEGAHVHYYLFRERRLIQLVLQVVPASQLSILKTTFERIAGTFEIVNP